MKVVALQCSFENQLEFCSKMLPLLRYEVKGFFLNENKTKQHNFDTFRKLGGWATTIVSWENFPEKEGAYPEREIDTQDRLQKANTH
jgi:hypothetical protein